MVPKPTSEAEAGHGGVEKGRGDGESAIPKELLGECQRPGHPEEEGLTRRPQFATESTQFAAEMKEGAQRLGGQDDDDEGQARWCKLTVNT